MSRIWPSVALRVWRKTADCYYGLRIAARTARLGDWSMAAASLRSILDPPGARRRAGRRFYRRVMQRVRSQAPTPRLTRALFAAVADPARIIWVRPDDITRLAADDSNLYDYEIVPGDWDRRTTSLDASKRYRAALEHFSDGVAWEDTDYFRDLVPLFDQRRTVRGVRSFAELTRYYETHGRSVYESIQKEGFLPRSVPHVHIARDGELIYGTQGIERLAMAKVARVERMPCRVRTRHLEWQRRRERVARQGLAADGAAPDPAGATHPDLQDLVGAESGRSDVVDVYGIADRIPSMGGTRIGPLLRELARGAPAGTSIVEVGSWLGAGTAQLALGITERSGAGDVSLHSYDRWQTTRTEVQKAWRWGLRLAVGEDTLPSVRRTLDQIGVPVEFHQGDLAQAAWEGGGDLSLCR